jgi:RimJ/RimL family protein N-acetyltransferase
LIYRPMELREEQAVRELTRICHPTWPQRPKFWYNANPTVVAVEESTFPQVEPGRVVGYACYTVDNHPAGNSFIMYLRDSGVHPDERGRGIGKTLIEKRMLVGAHLGIHMFVGCTAPTNLPMRAALKGLGFHQCQRVPNYFAFNNPPEDGLLYIHAGDHDDES